ncbi:hypothetical protein KH172YL63_06600 [Bacillus sp. KH172YL63]|nr:hypothetical protein KH172YL63_06600 [Bacillus sp. KH172YL63]
MKFYLASSFANKQQVREISERLKQSGWKHTYDWTRNEKAVTLEDLMEIGQKEKDGIAESDIVILILPGGKGSHVELGLALGLNKRVIIYSPNDEVSDFSQTTTFYHLPEVETCTGSIEDLLNKVTENQNQTVKDSNMKFVLLFGPQAVGKMTVGRELERITGLKLFHNHMTIDLLEPFFGFGPEMWKLSGLFRQEVFNTFAAGDQKGMIFTFVWAFNEESDWKAVGKMCDTFRSKGADIYFVELEAGVEERLKRNRTPYRLQEKPTKRNIEQSEQHLLSTMDTLRLNSVEGEIKEKHYLRINNENLEPSQVAEMIKQTFNF